MNISTALIKKYLKKTGGTAKRIQNLWIEVGTGNPKEIHFRFYWKQSGRRHYRHVASFGATPKPKQVKMADEKYQTMYANLRMGIKPSDTEASERKAIKWKELEHGYRLTVEQLFEEYFEVTKPNREPALPDPIINKWWLFTPIYSPTKRKIDTKRISAPQPT